MLIKLVASDIFEYVVCISEATLAKKTSGRNRQNLL
jgi:hypothetical protein